ncbi:LysM peptidoglycan-binding domain-containing protein [Patescibacteria group bacterium]|nr:LysM peptidoglycan-binding domain-containing protein [Patescibacteria group bacterium]MCL5798253.1 LysM peptidoglycan-binding domain-containing protein [Patescibacteria group bacterium]
MWKKYLKQLSMPESYISITLGFLVVVVAGLLFYNYINRTRTGTSMQNSGNTTTGQQAAKEQKMDLPTTHAVAAGETLWSIAQKYYNSGYNWVTIARANNLANPDMIEEGQKLDLPKADTITPPAAGEVSSAGITPATSYTVVHGDDLWNIAVREYGDGFAWTKIAKANNLVNPNLIHAGNVLKLPR